MDTYVREELVSKYKWLEKTPSQTYQQSRIDLYKAIKNHKEHNNGKPKFKSRNDTESIRFPQPKVDCKLYENHIKIPKMRTLIRVINSYSTTIKQENQNNNINKKGTKLEHGLYSGELRNITLIREKDGNYYISINCKVKTILTDYDKQQANKHRIIKLKELETNNKLTLKEKQLFKEQYYLEDTDKLLVSLDPGVVNTLTSSHNETFNTIPDKIKEPRLYSKYMKEKDSILRLEQKRSSLTLNNYEKAILELQANDKKNKKPIKSYKEYKEIVKSERLWDSKQLRKLNKRLNKKITHLTNIKDDRIVKYTTKLVRAYDFICLEDTSILSMTASAKGTIEEPGVKVTEQSKLNDSILNQKIGYTRQQLINKAFKYNKTVILVPAYDTSITCSQCNYNDEKNRMKQEIFKCLKCGFKCNADLNATYNIRKKGIKQYKEYLEELKFKELIVLERLKDYEEFKGQETTSKTVNKISKKNNSESQTVKKKSKNTDSVNNSVLRNAKEDKVALPKEIPNQGKPRSEERR